MELELALKSHMEGDLPKAESLYLSILEENPEQPDALHYLGILLHQKEKSDAALELVLKSLQLCPGRADWHNDMGNMLFERGLFPHAAEAFLNSIELEPGNAGVWNNMGSALEKMHRYGEAESAYGRAVAIDPLFADALNNLGNLLSFLGREVEAAEFQCRAYVLAPEGKPKSMLGIAYYKLGRIAEAAEAYRQWMLEEPDNPKARHLYCACSKIDVPPRASDAYIEKTFDDFSVDFDVRLAQLSYTGPQLIMDALAKVAVPNAALATLDAGCGTGLCGPLLRPYASSLSGVDLSGGMLEAARRLGVYDELTKMEFTRYLAGKEMAFDLIVASDTLTYFGSLEEVFRAVRRALKTGGLLIFTVEEADEGNYRINPHGRYSHGRAYLQEFLGQSFDILALESVVMRFEFGKPVDCFVVTASAR